MLIASGTPWLLLGDFNCVMTLEETTSVCSDTTAKCGSFRDSVNVHELLDLGFIGCKFTWYRGHSIDTVHAMRLNRGLCNATWHMFFPQASIKHLERATSDHCPLLLTLSDSQRVYNGGKFQFQVAWLKHPRFLSCVSQAWPSQGSMLII